MAEFPENLVFTACTGRCGQNSLVAYLNPFGADCLAEVEPPDLLYRQHWPLGNWLRHVQRRWLVTHEDLGRGKALEWHDRDEQEPLQRLAAKRLRRIRCLCRRAGATTYLEASKFFIRSYCDALFQARPDMGVLLLRRDPLMNARSFANRGKDFTLDGVMPHFCKACLPMDINRLSRFQLYLWQWVEIELRYQRFLESHNVRRHYEFNTEDLNDPARVEELFRFFAIGLKKPVQPLAPRNSNVSQGRQGTAVLSRDLVEFDHFVEMIPLHILNNIPSLTEYRQAYEGREAEQ